MFITVTKPGLATGLTLTTNKRVYLITLRSVGKSRVRLVRWTYDDEPVRTVVALRLLPDPASPQRYHVGYTMQASEPLPVKTFVLLPTNLAAMPAPMIRLIGPNGFELVNSRQVGSVLVLDHLFNVAELRIGVGSTAETVRITRQQPRTIACPGDAECPVWPETLTAQRNLRE